MLGTKGSAPPLPGFSLLFLVLGFCCHFGACCQPHLTFGISRKYSSFFLEEQIRPLTGDHAYFSFLNLCFIRKAPPSSSCPQGRQPVCHSLAPERPQTAPPRGTGTEGWGSWTDSDRRASLEKRINHFQPGCKALRSVGGVAAKGCERDGGYPAL